MVDLDAGRAMPSAYRLPFGVEGAKICWHGDNLLMCGGMRAGDRLDSSVYLLNLSSFTIASVR